MRGAHSPADSVVQMTSIDITRLGAATDEWFYLIAGLVLIYELAKNFQKKRLSLRSLQDMFASISTQLPYVIVEFFILGIVYVGYVYVSETFVSWSMPINIWTILIAVLACDFLYYWEHRLAHEVRILWTQHAVHHSSRHMNVLVAIRFGPFEGAISTVVHFPLILIGIPPELVFFGILAVLAYQGWIHTEAIGRLGFLDGIFNTPSNHRVHHGCDDKYLDRNYGGVLIIWDRFFGTYQREEEKPRFGLKRDFDSVNPLRVWVSEWPGLFRDLLAARSIREAFMVLFAHPDWVFENARQPDHVNNPVTR